MKSITKLMVVAMLLAAALVVAPAAARTIEPDGTVFIGEKDVDLHEVFELDAGKGTLVYYSSITTGVDGTQIGTIQKTVTVPDITKFEFTATDFGSLTGQWYAFPGGIGDLSKMKTEDEGERYNGTILVQKPSVKLDVKLWDDNNKKPSADSVDGKTVTRNSIIAFEIEHNLGDVPEKDEFQIDIEVTTPSGGKLNKFGKVINESADLRKLNLTGQKVVVNETYGISLKGEDAGTYTAIAKWPSNSDFYGKGYDSNTVTFEILSKAIAISSNKDTVVRGKNFVVTITGESKQNYWVFVKDASLSKNQYPKILEGQPGVYTEFDETPPTSVPKEDDKYIEKTVARVETKADGTRTVEFETTPDTKDRQFTIRVEETKGDSPDYDEVRVRVEEGAVTITASGTGVYYIGEEITLSGTCTEGEYVYLFMTGPNLKTNGVKLDNVTVPARTTEEDTFKKVEVEADDTWSYKWNTADIVGTLDAGGYTIWAASKPVNKDDLSDATYDSVSIHLNTGYLSATVSGTTVAKGDELKITGTAMGDPDNVYIWIFGKNYYGEQGKLKVRSETVESDGSFELTLKTGDTKHLSAGQYFVIIQHPMGDGVPGVKWDEEKGTIEPPGMKSIEITKLQASDAAAALINALDSLYVDDTYVKLTFTVEEPRITIDPIGIKEAGSKFTITGTTNMAVGDKLIVEVTSSAFGPTQKGEAGGFGSVSGIAVVEKGDGVNKWSFEVDAATLKPDEYIVKVECVETDTTTTAIFDLIEAVETTPPAGEVTTPPAEETTTPPAEETTTEPTPPTPGFGALVALAGLGAVAFLVLRRK
jgi:PGF-CTERM protein